MKVTQRDLEVLARVKAHEPQFIEWLKGRLEKHRDEAMTLRDDVDVRIAQGRGQELTDILKLLADANEILRKADNRAS